MFYGRNFCIYEGGFSQNPYGPIEDSNYALHRHKNSIIVVIISGEIILENEVMKNYNSTSEL